MEHRIKTIQPYFDDVKGGIKDFELRKNDRNYQVGDTLILEEFNNTDLIPYYTGQSLRKTVIYVLKDIPQYGLQEGYCILGLEDAIHPITNDCGYEPMCPYGYIDCVYDCNYIKAIYPNWYKDLGCPTECSDCKDGDMYNDEDK